MRTAGWPDARPAQPARRAGTRRRGCRRPRPRHHRALPRGRVRRARARGPDEHPGRRRPRRLSPTSWRCCARSRAPTRASPGSSTATSTRSSGCASRRPRRCAIAELAAIAAGRLRAGSGAPTRDPTRATPARLDGDTITGDQALLLGRRRPAPRARAGRRPRGRRPLSAAWVDLTVPGTVEVDRRWFRGRGHALVGQPSRHLPPRAGARAARASRRADRSSRGSHAMRSARPRPGRVPPMRGRRMR